MTDNVNFAEANRIIYLTGTIDEPKAEAVITKMLQYESKNSEDDILFYIDSYGGMVDSFVSIHDTIKMLRCNVATICIGKAMSCGQMLLISGTKGKRFITPNSRVLIHQLSFGTEGKLKYIENNVKENQRMNKEVWEKYIVKYTHITKIPFKFGKVSGDFYCSDNQLTTLKGVPQNVGGDFYCSYNQLTTVEGAPQNVGGNFYYSGNPKLNEKEVEQYLKFLKQQKLKR